VELRDDTGQLLPSVTILVNGQDIRYLQGLNTTLRNGDEMAILVPLAGGEG